MKTEREIRIETELAKFSPAELKRFMYDLGDDCVYDLATEAGHPSAREFLNNTHSAWTRSLNDTIEELVNDIYTFDGRTYPTMSAAKVAADLEREFTHCMRDALQGDAVAQYNLGWMYANGNGVPQDDAEAVKWYKKAAEQGDADAQFNLDIMYAVGGQRR